MTDERFTLAEFIAISVALLAALGVGVLPNGGPGSFEPAPAPADAGRIV